MLYVKNLNGQVKGYKDHDIRTVEFLINTGKWIRVQGLKDCTPYSTPKKAVKKKTTEKSK